MKDKEIIFNHTRPSPAHRNSICFLRLIFAIFVIYSHSWYLGGFGSEPLSKTTDETLLLGTIGVQAFFSLSGMLVAKSWQRNPQLLSFLWHRCLRLLPAFWICLFFIAFVFTPILHLTTPDSPEKNSELLENSLQYVAGNFVNPRAVVSIGGYPNNVPKPGDWNGSLWTLFYEAAAYLIVAIFGLCSFLGRRQRSGFALLILLLSANTLWHLQPEWFSAIFSRAFDTPGKQMIFYFFAGMAWILKPSFFQWLDISWVYFLLFGIVLVFIPFGLYPAAAPWLMAPILAGLAQHLPFAGFEKAAGGDYSYGFYLYGYPVQQVLAHFHIYEWGFIVYFGLSIILALGMGVISWHFIEKPSLRLKSWIPSPQISST